MGLTASKRAEISRLFLSSSQGEASEEDVAALNAMLRESADARRYFQRLAELHASLSWRHLDQGIVPPALRPDAESPVTEGAGRRSWGLALPTPLASLSAGTALATSLAAVVLAVVGVAVFRGALERPEAPPGDALVVAELRDDHDCVWGGSRRFAVGDPLESGERMELLEGVAKLAFRSDVTVVIESPSVVELATANSMRLDSGTVGVRTNGPTKDFVVISPEVSIVDLGTSFGVHTAEDGSTEVAVFEGAVEVHSGDGRQRNRVLGMGSTARVQGGDREGLVDIGMLQEDRFDELLAVLWDDVSAAAPSSAEEGDTSFVAADFADGPTPGTVDTFYGAKRGRGWLTPWVASGNPLADMRREDPLSGEGDLYLATRFYNAHERAIAREYGSRERFDANKPHVISWKWRFDGEPADFQEHFRDRVYFYGNPYFRRNSWPTNSWLIGVVGGHEREGDKRQVFPGNWYVFDGGPEDEDQEFDRGNMVDTGLSFKPAVVYSFVVVVYPTQAKYDVAIRDDEQSFKLTGLTFRNARAAPANVVHFGVASNQPDDNMAFSLDALRIEQLTDSTLEERIESQ